MSVAWACTVCIRGNKNKHCRGSPHLDELFACTAMRENARTHGTKSKCSHTRQYAELIVSL